MIDNITDEIIIVDEPEPPPFRRTGSVADTLAAATTEEPSIHRESGIVPAFSWDEKEPLAYEVDLGGGATETYDALADKPAPVLDPVTQAKVNEIAAATAHRLMVRANRDMMLKAHRRVKKDKSRRKKKLEKASRKRNRK